MFSVMNSIRNSLPKTEEAVLNILVIQDDHSEYVYDLCTIPNVNVISYFNNIETQTGNEHEALSVFQVRKYPENLTVINDLDNVLFSHFDYVICFGKRQSGHISNELKKRSGCNVILVDDASEETHTPRPFGSTLTSRIPIVYDSKVVISSSICESSDCIPPIDKDITFSQIHKINKFCYYHAVPQPTRARFTGILNEIDAKEYSKKALIDSEIFIDTIIGVTPHLLQAIKSGCFIICPYSKEASRLLNEQQGMFYTTLTELKSHVNHFKNIKPKSEPIYELANEIVSDSETFTDMWQKKLRK